MNTTRVAKPSRRWLGAALAGIAAIGLSLTGCAPTPATDGGDTAAGKPIRIAFVPAVGNNPFYETIASAMVEEAKNQNATIEYQATQAFDPTQQTTLLNSVLVTRPDVLIVAPTDSKALRAPIQKFIDAGIVVILVDLDLDDTTGITSRILGDNEQGGRVAAQGLLEAIGDRSGSISVMNIAPGFPTLDARVKGFTEEINAAGKDLTVLPQEAGGGDPASGQEKMRSILLAIQDLVGFFGVVETNAEGAAVAIKAAGKSSDIPIVGFDLTPTEEALLRDGTISYLSVQDPRFEGTTAVQYARAAIDGNDSAIEKLVTVNALGVDKSNIDSPEVQARVYNGTID